MIETGRQQVDTEETRALRAGMVASLVADGDLTDERWKRVFETVPRHLLVPKFYEGGTRIEGEHDRDRWLRQVYSDSTLITQRQHGIPTSSGTMPSLLGPMLDALDVDDGDRVLQVAMGTGYTAALLCERLGSSNVVTIDVDPDITRAARERLQHCGYTPAVATGDGALGYPADAPYDRIIVTFGVKRVPPAWIEQTRPGGIIVAPVLSGVVKLRVLGPGVVQGPFIGPGYFIRHRPTAALTPPQTSLNAAKHPGWPTRSTDLPSATYYDNDFRFVLDFTMPNLVHGYRDGDMHNLVLYAPDGSHAHITPDGQVTQTGEQRVWDEVERIHKTWVAFGQPPRVRFGLTVSPDEQYIWLDSPGSRRRWVL